MGKKKRGHLGLIMVAVKGGGGAGNRVEVVVVLLAPLSVERGGGREGLGVGGVRGMVQLLPTSVLLLLPTRVVGARSSSSLSRPRSRGPPPAPESLGAGTQRGGVGLVVGEARAEGGGLIPGGGGAGLERRRRRLWWRRHRGEAHREGKARRRRRD